MNEKRLSRRQFLISTSALAAGGVLAACAPKPAPPQPTSAPAGEGIPTQEAPIPAPAKGTLIRFWTGWGGTGTGKSFQQIQESEEFKAALGNNTFELKDAVNNEAMLAAVAAGDPPDGGSCIEYLDFMARDALLPIDDMVAASSVLKKEDFLDGTWDFCSYKGVTYGVPAIEGFLPFGLNYNARLVSEAGLDPDKPPVTWDEAYAWHEKLTKFDDAGNLLRIGLNPYGAMAEGVWYAGGWVASISWGWNWFNEDEGTFDLNNEKMIDVYATFKKFIDLAGVDNMTSMYSVEGRDTWGGAFNAEVEAMIIEGYWHPGETANEAPEISKHNRATWLPVPESRRGAKVQGSYTHMVVIFNGAKNPQGMFKIAEVLTTRVACDAFFKNLGWLPPIKAYYATVDGSIYPGLQFYLDSVAQHEVQRTPKCEITAYVSNEYMTLGDKVNRNEMTPAEAAAEFQRRCEAEYEAAGFKS